jgi:hypothetical protein
VAIANVTGIANVTIQRVQQKTFSNTIDISSNSNSNSNNITGNPWGP